LYSFCSIGLHAVWKGVGRSHTSCGQLHFKVGPGFYLTVPRGNTHTFDALTHKRETSFFFLYLSIHLLFCTPFFSLHVECLRQKNEKGLFLLGRCMWFTHTWWNLPASYTFLKWTLLAIFFTHHFLVMCAGVWHFFSLSFSPLSCKNMRIRVWSLCGAWLIHKCASFILPFASKKNDGRILVGPYL
jgi:hypothetical protein